MKFSRLLSQKHTTPKRTWANLVPIQNFTLLAKEWNEIISIQELHPQTLNLHNKNSYVP